MAYIPSMDLVPRVLEGNTRAIARLLSRAENGNEEGRPALEELFRRAGRAHVVGITGVPGSGKSTLVAKLTAAIRASGRKVAIIAVDPSSPYSGGAILGDRIRMADLAGDKGVYVRSMATRGALGGLARGTLEAVDIVDAAGYDMVLIETVGVGQDEVDVARASHTTVVVSAPGLGDDIQAIKAGVLEIADIHVVSKCDKPDADRTISDLKNMLTLGLGLQPRPRTALGGVRGGPRRGERGGGPPVTEGGESGSPASRSRARWQVPVLPTSALGGTGIVELLQAIDEHGRALKESGEIVVRQAAIAERRLVKASEEMLRDSLEARRGELSALLKELAARRVSPHYAARKLLMESGFGGDE